MDDEPLERLWHDGEVHPVRGWIGPTRRRLTAGQPIECVRCGSTLLKTCYDLAQQDKSSGISVCITCCLVLQSSGAIITEDHLYELSAARQRAFMKAEFYDPARWRSAQFVLHLPNNSGIIVDGAVTEIDDDSYVQIVRFEDIWFWKGRFVDVYRSGEQAFGSFDQAANHAFKALLRWFDDI